MAEIALQHVFLPARRFSLSVSLHQCPTVIFIRLLLFPGGQIGNALLPSYKQCTFLRNFAKAAISVFESDCLFLSLSLPVCLSVCPGGTTLLPLDGMLLTLQKPN